MGNNRNPAKSWSGTCGAHGPWASATEDGCPGCRGVTMNTLMARAQREHDQPTRDDTTGQGGST